MVSYGEMKTDSIAHQKDMLSRQQTKTSPGGGTADSSGNGNTTLQAFDHSNYEGVDTINIDPMPFDYAAHIAQQQQQQIAQHSAIDSPMSNNPYEVNAFQIHRSDHGSQMVITRNLTPQSDLVLVVFVEQKLPRSSQTIFRPFSDDLFNNQVPLLKPFSILIAHAEQHATAAAAATTTTTASSNVAQSAVSVFASTADKQCFQHASILPRALSQHSDSNNVRSRAALLQHRTAS